MLFCQAKFETLPGVGLRSSVWVVAVYGNSRLVTKIILGRSSTEVRTPDSQWRGHGSNPFAAASKDWQFLSLISLLSNSLAECFPDKTS